MFRKKISKYLTLFLCTACVINPQVVFAVETEAPVAAYESSEETADQTDGTEEKNVEAKDITAEENVAKEDISAGEENSSSENNETPADSNAAADKTTSTDGNATDNSENTDEIKQNTVTKDTSEVTVEDDKLTDKKTDETAVEVIDDKKKNAESDVLVIDETEELAKQKELKDKNALLKDGVTVVEEEVEEEAEVQEYTGNYTWSTRGRLTYDLYVYGDMWINAPIDLNGHYLYVSGSVYASSDTTLSYRDEMNAKVTVGGTWYQIIGSLTLGDYAEFSVGNFRLQTIDWNGTISRGVGYVNISTSTAKFTVNGNVFVQSPYGINASAGQFEVRGNITTIEGAIYGSAKWILSGSSVQNLSFYAGNTTINSLEMRNNSTISVTGYLPSILKLESDVVINPTKDYLDIYKLNTNGNICTINRSVTLNAGVTVNGSYSSLIIKGSALHKIGTLKLTNGGCAEVTGEYRLQGWDPSTKWYCRGSGSLNLDNYSSRMTVGSHMVVRTTGWVNAYRGTIEIKGNLTVVEGRVVGDNGTYCFSGSQPQTANFMVDGSFINKLEMQNNNKLWVGGYVNITDLVSDVVITPISNKYYLDVKSLDTNGHNCTINGSISIIGGVQVKGSSSTLLVTGTVLHKSGEMNLTDSGSVVVNGEYRLQSWDPSTQRYCRGGGSLNMRSTTSKMTVGSHVVVRTTGWANVYQGTFETKGNITVVEGKLVGDNGKIILSGAQAQTVNFMTANSFIHNLTMQNNNKLNAGGYVNIEALSSDVEITPISTKYYLDVKKLYTKGYKCTINGSISITDTVNVSGTNSKLTVTGNVLHKSGKLRLADGGTVDVRGEYRIQGWDTSTSSYCRSSGNLEINGTATKMTVGSNAFVRTTGTTTVTKGAMEIKGNLKEIEGRITVGTYGSLIVRGNRY